MAVAELYTRQNTVVMDNFRGEQFVTDFVTLRTSTDPGYEVARRMLVLQYPTLMTDMFATRLQLEVPADMRPGGTLPPRLLETPPVLSRPGPAV